MRQDAWKVRLGRWFGGAPRNSAAPSQRRVDRPSTPTWPEFDALVRRLGWAGMEDAPTLPAADWPEQLARVKALRHRVLEELPAAGLTPERSREVQETLLLGWQVVFQVWALQEGLFERHDPAVAARRRDELRQTYLQRTGAGEPGA